MTRMGTRRTVRAGTPNNIMQLAALRAVAFNLDVLNAYEGAANLGESRWFLAREADEAREEEGTETVAV